MSKSPITIVADSREPDGGVVQALADMDGVDLVRAQLPLGDYLVDGKLLFERKTLNDLVGSIKDGRLFSQARRLANSKLRGIIILEGTTADLSACKMSREAIQGTLISLTVTMGIPLLRSCSPQESARLLRYTALQVRSIVSGAIPRRGIRPKGKRRAQLEILQGLPGIGPVRAERLLNQFGTVRGVVAASAAELTQLSGIGPETAERIMWAVNEPRACYTVTGRGVKKSIAM